MNYPIYLLASAVLSATVSAHMLMAKPASIRWEGNPNTISPPDYNIRSPLLPNGSDFPCKGYVKLFNTTEGASVESWRAGSTQTFIINGTSPHNGGSCQASISEDGGATFKVLKSFIGDCPVPGKEFSFTVPREAKLGKVIFAWTWFPNTSASPEMYMNCAAVTITGTGGSGLSKFPDIFVANIGNGCTAFLGDVVIPNPGGDVETASNSTLGPILPLGGSACPTVSIFVPSTSTSSSTSTSASASATSSFPKTTSSRPTSNSGAAAATSTSVANSPIHVGITGLVLSVVLLATFSLFFGSFI